MCHPSIFLVYVLRVRPLYICPIRPCQQSFLSGMAYLMSPFQLPHVPVFVFSGYRISRQQYNCIPDVLAVTPEQIPKQFVPITNIQVVSMDAGHLKGSWNGVMYILSMKDSNNHIIHVATVLADKENETNCRCLLDQTCKNEVMKTLLTSGTATFYTDSHRGSPPALAKVVPTAVPEASHHQH